MFLHFRESSCVTVALYARRKLLRRCCHVFYQDILRQIRLRNGAPSASSPGLFPGMGRVSNEMPPMQDADSALSITLVPPIF